MRYNILRKLVILIILALQIGLSSARANECITEDIVSGAFSHWQIVRNDIVEISYFDQQAALRTVRVNPESIWDNQNKTYLNRSLLRIYANPMILQNYSVHVCWKVQGNDPVTYLHSRNAVTDHQTYQWLQNHANIQYNATFNERAQLTLLNPKNTTLTREEKDGHYVVYIESPPEHTVYKIFSTEDDMRNFERSVHDIISLADELGPVGPVKPSKIGLELDDDGMLANGPFVLVTDIPNGSGAGVVSIVYWIYHGRESTSGRFLYAPHFTD